MSGALKHTRINPLPIPEPIAAGYLESFRVETQRGRRALLLDYLAYVPDGPGQIFVKKNKLVERTRGSYRPRRLRFLGVENLGIFGPYRELDRLPKKDPARTIVDLYAWRAKGEDLDFYLLFGRSAENAEMRCHARRLVYEQRSGDPAPVSFERDWSPAPPMTPGLVPLRPALHRNFGGDPVPVILDGRLRRKRLFIGSLETQDEQRPQVQAVLNLGEHPSRWVEHGKARADDRWSNKGEGAHGMSIPEILLEAGWVVDRLKAGQRVLVHCVAGMNRSATICCAVLILLEGLGAEAALARLRLTHPWARPDSHHWLALKWLTYQRK